MIGGEWGWGRTIRLETVNHVAGRRRAELADSFAEEGEETALQSLKVQCLALPDRQNLPTQSAKFAMRSDVPVSIALKFRNPIASVRRGNPAATAAVHVPEAATYLDYLPQAREHQIRCAGECANMEAIAVAEPVNHAPHRKFRRCVPRLHSSHDSRSVGLGESVGHVPILAANGSSGILPLL
jgi:hypothetical protein